MKLDHYKLYPLLANGEKVQVEYEGVIYRFQFRGLKWGSENYLLVTNPEGVEKKFGWGWGYEEVMRALNHLKKGWDTEQFPAFRLYNEKGEVEGKATPQTAHQRGGIGFECVSIRAVPCSFQSRPYTHLSPWD